MSCHFGYESSNPDASRIADNSRLCKLRVKIAPFIEFGGILTGNYGF